MLLHFHNPSCGYNQRGNVYQETVPLLQLIFTSLFHPYLFKLSSLRSPLTLPSYITQQFFTSLFLRTNIPTIYIKNIFPQTFCQFRLRQGTRELWSIVRTDTVLISPFFLKVWTVIAGLTHNTDSLSIRLKKLIYSSCDKPSNPYPLIPSTYFHYFHIQLIPPQELTFSWKPAA